MAGAKRLLRAEVTNPRQLDETLQVLVTIWDDDSAEIAVRPEDSSTWDPPVQLVDWPTE